MGIVNLAAHNSGNELVTWEHSCARLGPDWSPPHSRHSSVNVVETVFICLLELVTNLLQSFHNQDPISRLTIVG